MLPWCIIDKAEKNHPPPLGTFLNADQARSRRPRPFNDSLKKLIFSSAGHCQLFSHCVSNNEPAIRVGFFEETQPFFPGEN